MYFYYTFSLSLPLSFSLSLSLLLSLPPSPSLSSNYTILSFSCPLTDIMRVGAKDGDSIEEALSRIQTYLCRNHSDEKLEMKLAKVRQRTLLATSQQTVRE